MKREEKVRAHIIISGMVQGVFFRSRTQSRAKSLGITGWVKNLPDGRVEAVFEGKKEKVEKLIGWAKKGPVFARVNGINIEWQEYKEEFDNFEIRYN